MQVNHHSLFYLFAFFYLCSVPSFHLISFDFFLFSSYLMFDLGSASTLYSCLFDVSIPLSSLFVWRPLSPGLMTFLTHCISCIRGMGIIIIGIFEPSFLSFLSPYYLNLRYVPHLKTTLWSWLHTLCLMAHTWAILEISWRLFLGAWQMGSWGDGFTLGHTLFISDGFSEVIWSILGHTPHIDDVFLVRWRFTLRHSQFVSSLGLWWIKSCGMTLH